MRTFARKFVALTIAVQAFAFSSLAPVARAEGLVPTEQVLAEARAARARSRRHEVVDRPEIASELARLGVAPEEARASIDALSDAELAAIAGKLDEQPAGAWVGAVIGAFLIVFFVLLLTDIIGVTDVYPWVNHPRR
jgi:hypothetical protein